MYSDPDLIGGAGLSWRPRERAGPGRRGARGPLARHPGGAAAEVRLANFQRGIEERTPVLWVRTPRGILGAWRGRAPMPKRSEMRWVGSRTTAWTSAPKGDLKPGSQDSCHRLVRCFRFSLEWTPRTSIPVSRAATRVRKQHFTDCFRNRKAAKNSSHSCELVLFDGQIDGSVALGAEKSSKNIIASVGLSA